MLSLDNLRIIFPSFSLICKLLILLFVGIFIWHSYQLYVIHENYLKNFYKLSFKDKTPHLIMDIIQYELHIFYILITQVFFVIIVKLIINQIPISKNQILEWDNNNEVNAILGRFIAYHFRYHKYINLSQLSKLICYSNTEQYFLKYHKNIEFKKRFLSKYDSYYDSDFKDI